MLIALSEPRTKLNLIRDETMRQNKNYTEPIWTNSKPRGSSKVKGQVKVHVGQAKGEISTQVESA